MDLSMRPKIAFEGNLYLKPYKAVAKSERGKELAKKVFDKEINECLKYELLNRIFMGLKKMISR